MSMNPPNRKCEICGKWGTHKNGRCNLHYHHISYIPSKVVSLCELCHHTVHLLHHRNYTLLQIIKIGLLVREYSETFYDKEKVLDTLCKLSDKDISELNEFINKRKAELD